MNLSTISFIFKNKDMRKRILAVIGMVIVFRFLSHVPIPLGEPSQLRQLLNNIFSGQQLFGFIDLLSGGALANFSIMLMGLGPYINSSIIMQLLTKAIPKLETLNKEGETGRRKINQYTRILTLPLAIVQSIGVIFLLRQTASAQAGIDIGLNANLFDWVVMVSSLVGGSMLLMWLGELVSEQGVGNGISLLIFAGIISSLPSTIASMVKSVFDDTNKLSIFGQTLPVNGKALLISSGMAIGTIILTFILVKLNEAQRTVTISYAKRVGGNQAYGGVDSILPIKLITAGVVPIIFAVAFLSLPSFAGQLMQNANATWAQDLGRTLVEWFQSPQGGAPVAGIAGWLYPILYFLLVVVFTYFYTSITFNSKELAENLQKQGGFIPGIRPGSETEKYLDTIVVRLTLFGSLALGILAILPILLERWLGTTQLAISGTGILIIVSVALETLRQIESRALMISYDSYE